MAILSLLDIITSILYVVADMIIGWLTQWLCVVIHEMFHVAPIILHSWCTPGFTDKPDVWIKFFRPTGLRHYKVQQRDAPSREPEVIRSPPCLLLYSAYLQTLHTVGTRIYIAYIPE